VVDGDTMRQSGIQNISVVTEPLADTPRLTLMSLSPYHPAQESLEEPCWSVVLPGYCVVSLDVSTIYVASRRYVGKRRGDKLRFPSRLVANRSFRKSWLPRHGRGNRQPDQSTRPKLVQSRAAAQTQGRTTDVNRFRSLQGKVPHTSLARPSFEDQNSARPTNAVPDAREARRRFLFLVCDEWTDARRMGGSPEPGAAGAERFAGRFPFLCGCRAQSVSKQLVAVQRWTLRCAGPQERILCQVMRDGTYCQRQMLQSKRKRSI